MVTRAVDVDVALDSSSVSHIMTYEELRQALFKSEVLISQLKSRQVSGEALNASFQRQTAVYRQRAADASLGLVALQAERDALLESLQELYSQMLSIQHSVEQHKVIREDQIRLRPSAELLSAAASNASTASSLPPLSSAARGGSSSATRELATLTSVSEQLVSLTNLLLSMIAHVNGDGHEEESSQVSRPEPPVSCSGGSEAVAAATGHQMEVLRSHLVHLQQRLVHHRPSALHLTTFARLLHCTEDWTEVEERLRSVMLRQEEALENSGGMVNTPPRRTWANTDGNMSAAQQGAPSASSSPLFPEALLLLGRGYSGLVRDRSDLLWQRRQLLQYCMSSPQSPPSAAHQAARGQRRWRIRVIVVLAVRRLWTLLTPSYRECSRVPLSTMELRVRLPPASCVELQGTTSTGRQVSVADLSKLVSGAYYHRREGHGVVAGHLLHSLSRLLERKPGETRRVRRGSSLSARLSQGLSALHSHQKRLVVNHTANGSTLSTTSSRELHAGDSDISSIFADEVLRVIQTLDQRASEALERSHLTASSVLSGSQKV